MVAPTPEQKWKQNYFILFYPHPRTCSMVLERGKGREGERERSINMREKHQLLASCTHPNQGPNPKPRHVPRRGIKPATFWFMGQHSNQLSHTSQGQKNYFTPIKTQTSRSILPHTSAHEGRCYWRSSGDCCWKELSVSETTQRSPLRLHRGHVWGKIF